MMNHYLRSIRRYPAKLLLAHALCRKSGPGNAASIFPLDVTIVFRRRRLGDIDRIRSRKGLFQPLLQRLIEPAFLGAFDALGSGAWSGHGGLSWLLPGSAERFGGWPR